jgi:acyl dehydratase
MMQLLATRQLASVPIDERYFEDYVEGQVVECGEVVVDEAEVLEFSRRFDPQPFHSDPVHAASGPFGGLIASGWHTAGLMIRLFVQRYVSSVANVGAPRADDLLWPRPVRPGDTLGVRVRVVSSRRSRSKPDRGLVWSFIEVFNQNQELVMSLNVLNFIRCRNP